MKKAGKNKFKTLIFIICLIISFSPGIIGSFFTLNSVNSNWYQSSKPSFTPPNYVFPIVWNILFLLIAFSLYFSWTNCKSRKQRAQIAWAFGLNLFFNALWSILFFKLQMPLLAFLDLALIIITLIVMLAFTSRISKTAFWLLIPYLAWLLFAAVLNWAFL